MVFERSGLVEKFRSTVKELCFKIKRMSMHEMATAARHSEDVLKNSPVGRSARFLFEHRH
jgi:hypothetical protein